MFCEFDHEFCLMRVLYGKLDWQSDAFYFVEGSLHFYLFNNCFRKYIIF